MISRTFAGHTAYYRSDGGGRDSYILYNNGGISKANSNIACQKLMRIDLSPPSHPIPTKVARYHPNGSGRDSYINQGWNTSESVFNASLRGGSPRELVRPDDIFTIAQRRRLRFRTTKIDTRALVKRLTSPCRRYSDEKMNRRTKKLSLIIH